MLHIRRFGNGPDVVALHGFSLTGETFSQTAEALGRTVIAPDLPGHGLSRSHPADVDSVTDSVVTLLEGFGKATPLLGYSQGGRIALLTTLAGHSIVSGLVLISSTPGIRQPIDRATRTEQDRALANRIRDIGVEAFIESWTSTGITMLDHLDDTYVSWDREVRMENTAEGLAAALRGYGQGAQPSVWDDLPDLTVPVLLVVGSRDERYTAINREMEQLIPTARLIVVDDAGHNPLADKPEITLDSISDFLDRLR
ncbi:MAG: 2-succinyl-6-hydroxy-2,4-cyclohexadiene-1-carboxylate synthase [Acidimicrobiia bacterium]|nr:MAG: 2-succinyl-6-hydroxy-2,4-cyclohexadiene-1-carboxylate synthase [Acidimicrobiia bacterium]